MAKSPNRAHRSMPGPHYAVLAGLRVTLRTGSTAPRKGRPLCPRRSSTVPRFIPHGVSQTRLCLSSRWRPPSAYSHQPSALLGKFELTSDGRRLDGCRPTADRPLFGQRGFGCRDIDRVLGLLGHAMDMFELCDLDVPRQASVCRTRMPIQLMSSSYHAKPWRAETGCAWWLLCQPSPNVSIATHQLLVESSRVLKRRDPHRCVAEFTSHVACRPTTVLEDGPEHVGQPPNARNAKPTTT